jgi:predicted dehydrogenase
MEPLRVGVIGVGHLGQHHARIYSVLPDTNLIAVQDLDKTRGQLIAKRYRVTYCETLAELLPQVDAVNVAVPTSAHYPVVKTCLEAGLHVLVEKPITSTIEEGHSLVRLAREKQAILQVGHIERFNPVVDVARSYIDKPGFLECHRLGPFQPRGTDVDVVLDLMIHDLDMVLSFNLGTVLKVEAVGMPVFTEIIDIANARIEFSQGCVANLTASRVSTGRLRKLRVFQPDCYLSVDYQAREAIIHQRVSQPNHESTICTQSLRGDDDEPLRRELLSFVNAVKNGTESLVSGEQGVASLELAHRVLEAIRGSGGLSRQPASRTMSS